MLDRTILGAKCFVAGIFATIIAVGCMHLTIDFHIDPDHQELTQSEKLGHAVKSEMKNFQNTGKKS